MVCIHVVAAGFKSHAALPDNPTQALAAHLTPLPLSPDTNWSDEVRTKLSAILSLMEKAESESAIGGEELLRKAYNSRNDIGPMRRMAAAAALCSAWREARTLGLFNDQRQFKMRISNGPDKGNEVLLEHIVPLESAPRFACEFANIRLVAPGRARTGTPVGGRDAAYVRTLNAIASEADGMNAPEKRQEELWKAEMERNGGKALELPRIFLFAGRLIATPSHRSGYRWVSQIEVINVSQNATEVELECIFIGTTDKHRRNYVMGVEKKSLRLRSGQAEKVQFHTPLAEGDYKQRTDDYEQLSGTERGASQASYRGTIFRVNHAKGTAATAATDPAMLRLLDADSKTKLAMLPNLHLDPKTWPKPDYLIP